MKLFSELIPWSVKIAAHDSRPAHPEDYVEMALQLHKKAGENNEEMLAIFNRVVKLYNDPTCHTENEYSFLDFWRIIVGPLPKRE